MGEVTKAQTQTPSLKTMVSSDVLMKSWVKNQQPLYLV